jgi:hypothetical protein
MGAIYPLELLLKRSTDFHKIAYWSIQFNIDFAKQQILLAKTYQFKVVVKTRRRHKRAGLIKCKNSFQGLAICTAMKWWCPYKREQSYSGHFALSRKWSDIRLWRMTVYFMENVLRFIIRVPYAYILYLRWINGGPILQQHHELPLNDHKSS